MWWTVPEKRAARLASGRGARVCRHWCVKAAPERGQHDTTIMPLRPCGRFEHSGLMQGARRGPLASFIHPQLQRQFHMLNGFSVVGLPGDMVFRYGGVCGVVS